MKPDVLIVAAAFRVPPDAFSRLATHYSRPETRGVWPTTLWRDLVSLALAELGYSYQEIGDIFGISCQAAGAGVRKGRGRVLRLKPRRRDFWRCFQPTDVDTKATAILARFEHGRELLRGSGFVVNTVPDPRSVLSTAIASLSIPHT